MGINVLNPLQEQTLKAGQKVYHDWTVRHHFVDGPIKVNSMMLVSCLVIIVYIVLSMLREFLQMYQQKWQYLFEPNNFISWLLYISGAIMVSPVFSDGKIADLHFSATSVTVFLSWFNLLLFLQRFDQVSHWLHLVSFFEYIFRWYRVNDLKRVSIHFRLESTWSCFWRFYKR